MPLERRSTLVSPGSSYQVGNLVLIFASFVQTVCSLKIMEGAKLYRTDHEQSYSCVQKNAFATCRLDPDNLLLIFRNRTTMRSASDPFHIVTEALGTGSEALIQDVDAGRLASRCVFARSGHELH